MRKRRTREHIIADLGVNHVERHVLRCGWTVERTRHDYGIDLMRTYSDTGEAQTAAVYMQVKSTDSLPLSADRRYVRLRLEWRDLLFWLNEPLPVILIVYDAMADRAFWLHTQDYFRRQDLKKRAASGTTVTVRIPALQGVDEDAVRRFAKFYEESMPSP